MAMTFTNKAVGEMKERILEMLKLFSDETIFTKPHNMFLDLCKALNMSEEALHLKSKKTLEIILHNYGAFDISTIDRFNHNIIRTFAHDLKIPQNFDVELDTDSLLNQAVDNLISKTGLDKELTNILVEFALEKTDDDRSWDISYDLNKVAKLLINENHVSHLDNLESKSLSDFKTLKKNVFGKTVNLETEITIKAQSALTLINECGLQFDDFSSGSLPKYFEKLQLKDFDVRFGLKWQEAIEDKPLYPSRVLKNNPEIASIIDDIQSRLASIFHETKHDILQYKLLKNIYKNLTPLSVLNAINSELNLIKEEQNLLLISEFNSVISNEIKNQPIPFIYERIGERYNHYFIDEFQDTSELQWLNIIPLIENSLSAENGSTMLVGDAKQAIYRWRGGKAEQFIELFNENVKPFPIKQQVEDLPVNYRSCKHIVEFNNSFFKHLSGFVFKSPEYAAIYSSCKQDAYITSDGLVDISLLEISREDDRNEIYCSKVIDTIKRILNLGYELKDICILVRKGIEGIAIADALNRADIPIISSETLLLDRSPEIRFIINVMRLAVHSENTEVKVEILNYIADSRRIENKHDFFKPYLSLDPTSLFRKLQQFDFEAFMQSSIYESVESVLRAFKLNEKADAYIQYFLDEVLNYSQEKQPSLIGFLNYWDSKKDKLSIVTPKGQNAVQIMTIHKAKGLEFPVVIFPFADLDIYREQDSKCWFKVDPKEFYGYDETLINLNKDVEAYSQYGSDIYNKHQAELELDNINILYVTFTRAIEQLYVIGKNDFNSGNSENLKSYSGLIINYLKSIHLWDGAKNHFTFGSSKRQLALEENILGTTVQEELISTSPASHNINIITNSGLLWDTKQKEAIERGNLLHRIMANISTESDINYVIEDYVTFGIINKDQKDDLLKTALKIVNHEQLKEYYAQNEIILTERDIITKDGQIFRPDRIIIKENKEAIIIDYKTGQQKPEHERQLNDYQKALQQIGYSTSKKILIYINENITVVEC